MKKVTKIISLLLATVMVTGICSSCGNKDEVVDSGKIKLTVGGWPATEGASLNDFNDKKARFEEANADIEIVPDTWTFDLKTFYPKAEAGLLPNTFDAHFTEFSKMVDGGYLLELTDYLTEKGMAEQMNPKLRDLVSVDGKIYSFPKKAYALGLAVNIDMMKEAGLVQEDGTPMQPKTWDELAEFAVKIKEATGKPGVIFPTASNSGGWYFTNLAWSFGVDFMEQDENGKWIATFDNDKAVQALQYMKDLRWKYDVLPAKTIVDAAEMWKLFSTGGGAMVVSHPDIRKSVASYEMDKNAFGFVAIPAGPEKWVSLLGGTLINVANNATEEQLDAVFRWYEAQGFTDKLDDIIKESMEKSVITELDNGRVVGIDSISIWSNDADVYKYSKELNEKHTNIDMNHVRLYNESLVDENLILQPEEPVCAQDLYGILDNIIQEVINNKDADCKALISKANADFQKNFLDKVDY